MFDHSKGWTKMHPMTGPPTWIDPIPSRVSDNDFGGGIIHPPKSADGFFKHANSQFD